MKNRERLKVKIQVLVLHMFLLVLIYALRVLLTTPLFSFFSIYNSLSIMLKIALTLIPFCCQGLVFGAGAGKPIYRAFLPLSA